VVEPPELLGCELELELESLLPDELPPEALPPEVAPPEVAPPEAEPDFAGSFAGSLVLVLPEALDELGELGELGVVAAEPPAEPLAEPDAAPEGGVDGVDEAGDDALLLLPALPADLPALSWPQAARPSAAATATAIIENFMCPPWLG
jgi:hypothetical protein